HFELAGAANTEDLDAQLQVLAAYVTQPGWRPEAFDRVRSAYVAQIGQLDASPQGVVQRELGRLLHGGDPRWAVPDADDAGAARLDDLKAVLSPALDRGQLTVTLGGDVTV